MLVTGFFSLCPLCLVKCIRFYLSPSAKAECHFFILLYEESCYGIQFTHGLILWSYLCAVEWRLAGPVKHMLVDVAVIATQHRIEHLIAVVKGIHQCHGVGPHLGQDVLQTLGDAGELRDSQQVSLKGAEERSSTRRVG